MGVLPGHTHLVRVAGGPGQQSIVPSQHESGLHLVPWPDSGHWPGLGLSTATGRGSAWVPVPLCCSVRAAHALVTKDACDQASDPGASPALPGHETVGAGPVDRADLKAYAVADRWGAGPRVRQASFHLAL